MNNKVRASSKRAPKTTLSDKVNDLWRASKGAATAAGLIGNARKNIAKETGIVGTSFTKKKGK